MSEANKALARRAIVVWSIADLEEIDPVSAADYVNHKHMYGMLQQLGGQRVHN
jgi:hypothetical protein